MRRLALLRKFHGDTQESIANMLGVDQSTVSQWETGKNPISVDAIFKLADRYGVTTDYLLGYAEGREFKDPDPVDLLKEYFVVKFDHLLPEDKLKRIDRIMDGIAELLLK